MFYQIVNFEGLYEYNPDEKIVRSIPRTIIKRGFPAKQPGRVLSIRKNKWGKDFVCLYKNKVKYQYTLESLGRKIRRVNK
jgi:hypothetical protein